MEKNMTPMFLKKIMIVLLEHSLNILVYIRKINCIYLLSYDNRMCIFFKFHSFIIF